MESISHLLKLLSQFKVVSALEVNTFKTEAMWLGKWNNRSDTPFNFNWPIEPNCAFVVVVVFFLSYNTTKADNLNFDEKLRKYGKDLEYLEKYKTYLNSQKKYRQNCSFIKVNFQRLQSYFTYKLV